MDHIRRKKRKKRFAVIHSLFGLNNEMLHEPPDFHHPGVSLDNKERAAVLFKAVEKLPENQRIAFTLNKLEGLNYQEISEVMNATVSSVESLLHRAKNNLKKHLEDYYRKGLGTTAYQDAWSVFDQIILGADFVNDRKGFHFYQAGIFNPSYLKQKAGAYKGYPLRTYADGVYVGGYSDHFPVYVLLVKEKA